MLLAEAAGAAGIGDTGALMGRPTCAMIPATLQHRRAAFESGLHWEPSLYRAGR